MKTYIIKFNKNKTMKVKEYSFDSKLLKKNCGLQIVITFYKKIFSANDRISKALTKNSSSFQKPKTEKYNIMVFDVLLPLV